MPTLPSRALVLAALTAAGCGRNAPPDIAPETVAANPPTPSPPGLEAPAETVPIDRSRSPSPAGYAPVDPPETRSIPTTVEAARDLMSRIDRHIDALDLEPGAAAMMRAGFRGRLHAAGIPPEAITGWVRSADTPP